MSLSGVRAVTGTDPPAHERVLAGRYRLQEIIGRGGMATVYRAVDTALDRSVAVKLLYPSVCSESDFVDQFLRMERHIARLFHPNLVTIYDAGATPEGCFAVMEYVPGGSLREIVMRGTRLPIRSVIRVAAQVADALQLLHRDRIIHGDVKPDNVLLDDQGNAKLVDFGIAHLATTTTSISSQSLGGSVPYLAPEQLENGRADARSDIYSLGLVLYELVAGRKAFDGENWVAVAAQRLARDPTPLSAVFPEVPPSLEQVVMRTLARNPDDRYASADELRRALLEVDRELADAEAAAGRAAGSGTRMLPTGYLERRPPASGATSSPAVRAQVHREDTVRMDAARPVAAHRPAPSPAALVLRGEHELSVALLAFVVVADLLILIAILAVSRGIL